MGLSDILKLSFFVLFPCVENQETYFMRGVGSASDQDDMNARSSAESLLPKSVASLAMSLGSMSLLYSFSVWQ